MVEGAGVVDADVVAVRAEGDVLAGERGIGAGEDRDDVPRRGRGLAEGQGAVDDLARSAGREAVDVSTADEGVIP